MKRCLLFLAALILLSVARPAQAAPPATQIEALEMESVFVLGHDELIDLQSDTKMPIKAKITNAERYISALTRFIKEYPKEFDTQNDVKDLTKWLADAKAIRDGWKAQ